MVDDEYMLADILAEHLREKGIDAQAFQGPCEVLRERLHPPPHLLVSDVKLQPFTGIELATRLRERSPNCRILLFSGDPEANHLLRPACFAGSDFKLLFGPILLSELVAQILHLIEGIL